MRIGFDAYNAFLNFSGIGNYSRTMIDLLSKYYGIGNKYFLFSGFDTNKSGFVIPEGTEVITPSNVIGDITPSFWRNFNMSRELRSNKIDIYHGLGNYLPYDIRWGGAKSIVTIHDLAFLKYPNFYNVASRYLLDKRFSFSCNYSDFIIATSQQTKEDIIENYKIASERISVVKQACSPIFKEMTSEEKKEQVRKKYNLPEKYILSVGTLEERKNLILTLHAIADGRLDTHLVACGRYTTYADELIDFTIKRGIQDKVHFMQNIHFYDLPTVYQCADALVYMSLFEGFGLPIIEAFNSCTPVITSKGNVLEETGGDACIYVGQYDLEDMIESIKNITSNDTLRADIIEKGKNRAKLFDESIIADNIFSVYNKLM